MSENEIISLIVEIVKKETGIVINKERKIDLEIVLRSRLIFHNMLADKYIDFIKNNYNEIIVVASCFTIQETSFYRYKAHFDRLKLDIIPELIKSNQNNKIIKILSAGCATGEEPYTIAMIINDLIKNPKEWEIHIIATDININALEIAKEAVYSEYKLRNIDKWYVNKYFTKIKNGKIILYKINDSIKDLVTFRQCNLIREPFQLSDLSDVDIIFCENVIIYFCVESIQRLINNFYNILKKDGYLFLGYSETLNFIKHKFSLSWWNDSFIYKKSEKVEKDEKNIFYNLRDLIPIKENNNEESLTNIEKTYNDIINLVIQNYNQELFDNVSVLLKKIESSDIKLDEIFYVIKAEFQFDRKNFINATDECRKAININPQSIDAHIILGSIYLQLKMFDSASFELKTSLYIDSSSILANYYFALFNKIIRNQTEYINHMNNARGLLNESKGILRTRLFPINKNTRKEIYDNILNLEY